MQLHGGDGTGGAVHGVAVGVVLADDDGDTGDLGGRRLAQTLHQRGHLLQTVHAGHHKVVGLFAVPAVLGVQRQQCVVEGHALGGVPAGHLRDEQGGGDGVLVADVVAQHIAIALLVGHDDLALTGRLQLALLLGHELEAGEGVVAGDAVGFRHLAGHVGGDDRLEEHRLFRQLTGTAQRADEIIQQQHAGLVAGDGDEPTGVVAHHDAHAVTVGVGAQNKVGADLVRQLDGQIEALGILRVGGVHRGEVAVQHHLLLYAVQVLDAQTPQRLRHQLPATAVERGVDHLEGIGHLRHGFPVVDHGHDVLHEGAVRLLAHDLNEAGLHRLVKVHALDTGEDVDLFQLGGDGVGVLGRQLGAVRPVDLVAVILLGVVAGGDIDARLTAVVADGKAQLRRGTQGLKNADMDAVGGADLRGGVGKEHIVVAAVHADGNALLLGVLTLGGDDIGKALGGPADDMDVHLVQTDLHGAAQTGGAELQRAVEAVFDLLFIAGDALQLRVFGGGESVAVEPALVFLFIAHIGTPFRVIMYLFLVFHGLGSQQFLRLLQTGGGDIQADAEAGKAVDDLAGAALAVVVFEAGDTVGRQQGDDRVGIGGGVKGLLQQDGLFILSRRVLGPCGDIRVAGKAPVFHGNDLLFVIFGAAGDLVCSVDLLQQHDTRHVMGKCHGGHGQTPVGLPFQLLVQTDAAADEEGDLGLALHTEVREAAAQFLAGAGLALDAHRHQRAALGQLFPDGGGLRLQGVADLGGGGLVGQAALRQLHDLQTAQALETLDILGGGVNIEFFLQLADAEDRYLLHAITSGA